MTCAVSAAAREGSRRDRMRLDRQHGRVRRGVRRPRRDAVRGDRARRQDRDREARPGARARRARDRAARQFRRGAGAGQGGGQPHPASLVNSVNDFRIEGQKTAAFEISEALDGELDALCIPVGNAGNITAYWRGFKESGARPRMYGFQAEGAAPLVRGAPVMHPETIASAIRIGNPARWEGAMDATTSSGGAVRAGLGRARSSRRTGSSPRGEGIFCEPASAASVAGLLAHGAGGAARVVCVLTGHGLKDPQTALEQASPVLACDPDLARGRAGGARMSLSAAAAGPSPRRRPRTSGRGSTCSRPRSRCISRSRSRRRGRFARRHRARRSARPRATWSCGDSSGCIRPTGSSSAISLGDPAVGRARLERRGDRRGAARRRPSLRARCRRAARSPPSSRAIPTTPRRRSRAVFVVCQGTRGSPLRAADGA